MTTTTERPLPAPLRLLVVIGCVAAAATVGNLATLPNIPTWYAGLIKPDFNPPNWIFGPVWTLLYVLMAIAFHRILSLAPGTPGRQTAIVAFSVQLVLNALWSVVFFGLHSPLGGIIVIALLWLAILASMARFARLDHFAAVLLSPYIAWVSFAALLNVALYRLN